MDNSDAVAFFERLVALAELLDAKPFSPAKSELYFDALRDLPLDKVLTALNEAAKTCTFMPKPAEIIKLAVGDTEDQIERAWIGFKTATRQAGHMASIIVDDPALGETIRAMFGSWPQACALELTPEMWTATRKEFGRVYRVMCDRALTGPRYLLGEAERNHCERPEWQRFTPVYQLGPHGDPKRLTAGEAEDARSHLAAATSSRSLAGEGMRQLAEGVDLVRRSSEEPSKEPRPATADLS